MPPSQVSFPVPVPHSPFRFLVPCSGSSFPVPVPRSPFRFLVPRSGSSFPVSVPCSPFRFLVPHSGSLFLVYRFITPSPLSEKEASLILGIIYTIICPGNAGPKIRNSLNLTSTGGGGKKTPRKSFPCAEDRPWSAWYGSPSCRACLCILVTPRKFLQARWDASPNTHYYTRGTRLRPFSIQQSSGPLAHGSLHKLTICY